MANRPLEVFVARALTVLSFSPKFKIVSIIPGIETLEPDLTDINNGFDNLSNAFEIQSQINIESIQYLPKLKVVRDKEKNIREFKKLIKDNETSISRSTLEETEKILTLKNENKLLNEKINNEKLNFPNNWVNEYKTFQNLIKSENMNRNKYRRSVDSSYEEIEIIHNILNKRDRLYKFEKDFIKFNNVLEKDNPKILSKEIKELSKKISSLPENSKITSKLSKVSRNLKKKKVNYKRVRKDFDKSFSIYLSKINSLKTIDENVENYLDNFLNDTRNTLGLRLQQSLPKDVALYLASCKSSHRNLSLYF